MNIYVSNISRSVGIVLIISLCLCVACQSRKERLKAFADEAQKHLPVITEYEAKLNAAASPADDTGLFGSATASDSKNTSWADPAEVVVVLKSFHEVIDRSPSAQSLSNTLRRMGSSGMSVNLGGRTLNPIPVPGGIKQRILDHISVKRGGVKKSLSWEQKNVDEMAAAATQLQQVYQNALEKLKAMADGDEPEMAEIVRRCESGAVSAKEIGDAAKEISRAQAASERGTKPDDKKVQETVQQLLKAGANLHAVAADYSKNLRQLSQQIAQ